MVRDGHTRRVLGRHVSDSMHTDLVEHALRQTVALRGVRPRKVIFTNEYYHRHTFATIDAARRGSYTWIDGWYNPRRRQSRIGYLSPLEYERRQHTLAA